MTKQLKWRLGKLPTPDEVLKLVNDKLITKEEARDILFNEETQEDIKTDDLKSEIKFLREIIEKLSNKTQIIETIRSVQVPYYINTPWYGSYSIWCSSGGAGNVLTSSGTGIMYSGTSGTSMSNAINASCSFSDINTF